MLEVALSVMGSASVCKTAAVSLEPVDDRLQDTKTEVFADILTAPAPERDAEATTRFSLIRVSDASVILESPDSVIRKPSAILNTF